MTKQKHFYLIRGLIREKGHWGSFLTSLEKAFPNAKFTTIDIPGAGEYWTSPTPLTVKRMVEEMRQDYLKYKKDNEQIHLMAISLGGMIAVEWMKAYPEDFQQATLINTSFGDVSPFHHRMRPKAFLFLLKVFILKGRQKESRILELVTNHPEIFSKTLDEWEVIARERPVSVSNTMKQLLAAGLFKAGNFSPPIPITILASTHDRMVSIECSRAIAKKWKLDLYEHPTGGHDITVDDPDWVVMEIKKTISAL